MGDQLLPRKSRLAPGPLSNNRVGALAVAAAAGILLMSSQVPANATIGNTEGVYSSSQNSPVLHIGSSLDGGRRFGPHGHHGLRDSHGSSDRGRGHKAGRNHRHAKGGKPGRANREGRNGRGMGEDRPSSAEPAEAVGPAGATDSQESAPQKARSQESAPQKPRAQKAGPQGSGSEESAPQQPQSAGGTQGIDGLTGAAQGVNSAEGVQGLVGTGIGGLVDPSDAQTANGLAIVSGLIGLDGRDSVNLQELQGLIGQ
ncbi:hypothetical protein SAMN05216276_108114 [Streptosporangium subroseum]|uniref:Uncharacterized protein n=1 Tax=Streptosporangium subroseum TaxID=106412 RepID=A0A239P1M8_9ACTN|nr:hypothetical protein SAMN05216276_108114 [Streptosporangium subroseum]